MIVGGWLEEMDHVFLYYFANQTGDGVSPEFVRVSLCLGFLVNGCREVNHHIAQELPTCKYTVDDVSQYGNDDRRCMLEMLTGDTEEVCIFVACQGPYMLQNMVGLNHWKWFTRGEECEEQPLEVH